MVSVDVRQDVYLLKKQIKVPASLLYSIPPASSLMSFPVTLASIPNRWIPSHRGPARLGPQERHLFPPLQSHPVLAESQTVTPADEHQL